MTVSPPSVTSAFASELEYFAYSINFANFSKEAKHVFQLSSQAFSSLGHKIVEEKACYKIIHSLDQHLLPLVLKKFSDIQGIHRQGSGYLLDVYDVLVSLVQTQLNVSHVSVPSPASSSPPKSESLQQGLADVLAEQKAQQKQLDSMNHALVKVNTQTEHIMDCLFDHKVLKTRQQELAQVQIHQEDMLTKLQTITYPPTSAYDVPPTSSAASPLSGFSKFKKKKLQPPVISLKPGMPSLLPNPPFLVSYYPPLAIFTPLPSKKPHTWAASPSKRLHHHSFSPGFPRRPSSL